MPFGDAQSAMGNVGHSFGEGVHLTHSVRTPPPAFVPSELEWSSTGWEICQRHLPALLGDRQLTTERTAWSNIPGLDHHHQWTINLVYNPNEIDVSESEQNVRYTCRVGDQEGFWGSLLCHNSKSYRTPLCISALLIDDLLGDYSLQIREESLTAKKTIYPGTALTLVYSVKD